MDEPELAVKGLLDTAESRRPGAHRGGCRQGAGNRLYTGYLTPRLILVRPHPVLSVTGIFHCIGKIAYTVRLTSRKITDDASVGLDMIYKPSGVIGIVDSLDIIGVIGGYRRNVTVPDGCRTVRCIINYIGFSLDTGGVDF